MKESLTYGADDVTWIFLLGCVDLALIAEFDRVPIGCGKSVTTSTILGPRHHLKSQGNEIVCMCLRTLFLFYNPGCRHPLRHAPTKWRHASAPTRPGGRWALQPTLSGPVRFPKALHGTTNRMSNMKSSIFGRQLIKLPVTGGRQFAVEPR